MTRKFILIFLFFSLSLASFASESSKVAVKDTLENKKVTKVITADRYSSRWAITTNLVDWGWFFTPNIEAQFSVASHFSLEAQAKFNAWTFFNDDAAKRNRQARQEYSLGFRWWPWYVYSGWWLGSRLQYQQYSRRPWKNIYQKEEGDAVGLAFAGGYSLQINSWFNIDFGLGFWTGLKFYKLYQSTDQSCPECGRRIDVNEEYDRPSVGGFFLPNEITVGLMFVF